MFKLVLWLVGVVIALLTGNLSVYILLTVIFLAPKAFARAREIRARQRDELESGE